ncbi:MAG TPA: HD domain-containing protein [Bacteroidales bacterium]|nr:HD domain-containing protein [Bacteroidales bacterium]
MDISKEIVTAEKLFRDKLDIFLRTIFSGTRLNSHGPEHHRRVWQYTKDILGYPDVSSRVGNSDTAVKLLIGAYLHDSGMVKERGPRHGALSREYCRKFLDDNSLSGPGFSDLLDAVEHHDDKEYLSHPADSILLDILTAADDLDALGYTGIYRYTEIYLVRGTAYKDLGSAILKNVRGRFGNLEKKFAYVPSLPARFRPAFDTITGFFDKYNIQLTAYRFGTGDPTGYCGVTEVIRSMIEEERDFDGTMDEAIESTDRVISWYFGELKREMG